MTKCIICLVTQSNIAMANIHSSSTRFPRENVADLYLHHLLLAHVVIVICA